MAGARLGPRPSPHAVSKRISSSAVRTPDRLNSVPPRSRAILLEKMRDGHDAQVVIFDLVLFVWGVQAVIGKAKAHQDGRNAEVRGEIAHDGNGCTGTDE